MENLEKFYKCETDNKVQYFRVQKDRNLRVYFSKKSSDTAITTLLHFRKNNYQNPVHIEPDEFYLKLSEAIQSFK